MYPSQYCYQLSPQYISSHREHLQAVNLCKIDDLFRSLLDFRRVFQGSRLAKVKVCK